MVKTLKKLFIIVAVILIAGYTLYMGYIFGTIKLLTGSWPNRVSSNFATKASLRFHYEGKAIDTVITDANDVKELKDILGGWAIRDVGEPSCGFDTDISITMRDGRKSITFCPANDGCSNFRIGKTQKYMMVSDAQMERFRHLVRKYGMTFPCI